MKRKSNPFNEKALKKSVKTYVGTTSPGSDHRSNSTKTKSYELLRTKLARRRLASMPPTPVPQPMNTPYTYEDEELLVARARLGDRHAGTLLLRAYDKTLCRCAKHWFFTIKGHDLELADLEQSARMGLMHAIHKFDPKKGTFSSYIQTWAMQHCVRIIQNEGFAIRVPVHQHQALSKHERKTSDVPMPPALHQVLLAKRPSRLDAPIQNTEQTHCSTRADSLATPWLDGEETLAAKQRREVMGQVVSEIRVGMTALDRAILDKRILSDEPAQLSDLGREHQRSRERARQRESVIKYRLRCAVRERLERADVL